MNKLLLAGAAAVFALAGSNASFAADKKMLAFVVNGASDFWKAAEAGVKKAQGELPNYNLVFKYPEQASAAIQIRLMDDLVAAPDTSRVAYIGSSNIDAGKQAGQLMLKALPNGGKCMGFVGLLGADNAKERIQGVKDTIAGSKISLVDVRGDDIDQTRAKRNVEDTLTANPDITCMVGFYSYNTPRIYEALKDAGKLKQITIIGFDEDPITLGGVKEGTIVGTVVQQPYEWGYQGMKDMAKYLEGDKSFIPANKLIIVPTKIIDPSNVDAFWAELKQRQGK